MGKVDASAAATFLKKSQLREPVLHKVGGVSVMNVSLLL